jgi:cystathionine beta-lyase
MNEIVELSEEQLRSRNCAKWSMYGPSVIPASVAEMDFAVAPPIQAAIERVVAVQDYGYPMRAGILAERSLGDAFVRRMQARFQWKLDAALVVPVTNLVQASLAAVLAFSDPGDGIVLQLPAFPPFREMVTATGRRIIPMPLRPQNGRYAIDIDELEASLDRQARVLVICNPHNPTGRMFDRQELIRLGKLAVARGMVIVSDEVYADLVFDNHRHVPMGTLPSDIADQTVTLSSAMKSFNMSGLRCGIIHFGSAALQSQFHARIPAKLLGAPDVVGIMATIAAWEESQPWLAAVATKLQAARDHLGARLQTEMPSARVIPPEAGYLAWIDFSGLNLSESAFRHFLARGVALSDGEAFDSACANFGRLNFATSRLLLDRIIDRMVAR